MRFAELLKAILFGVIEGVTEWLPVSSTGHLIILNEILRLDAEAAFCEFFIVAIQLGAMLAVPCVLGRRYLNFRREKDNRRGFRILRLACVGALPAALVGFLLDDILDKMLYNHTVVSLTLISYGVVFLFISKKNKGRTIRINSLEEMTLRDALTVGLFQTLSLIPGTSRSGSTFIGGYAVGASNAVSADFSFLMAMPIMLGATFLKLVKLLASGYIPSLPELLILGVSSFTSFLVSLISMRFLVDFVKRHSLAAFGVYRIMLGIAVTVFFAYK